MNASNTLGARLSALVLLSAAAALGAARASAAEVETIEIGLGAGHVLIEGLRVAGGSDDAPLMVLVGGFEGDDATSREIRDRIAEYAARPDGERGVNAVAIPVANPAREELQFPPTGRAYREQPASHTLWRWLGVNAPDLVILYDDFEPDVDGGGAQSVLLEALVSNDVAGVAPLVSSVLMGNLPVFDVITAESVRGAVQPLTADLVRPSPAHLEIDRRRARTPEAFAALLAPIYGQSWDMPIYIDGMALIAHLGLGDLALVERLAAPYVDGTRDSLQAGPNGVSTLTLAGHLVFAELAERTGDPRYLDRARAAANLSFDASGTPLEAVPNHGEMSDAIFMGASILAAVGDLTGERRYFDMAVRQIDFMNRLVRRDDGLYRHSPLTDAAWARGNGFSAIGYALTLSKLPASHPEYARLLGDYVAFMRTLARWQNDDGTWRQVIDHPGSYHETSSTAIIGFSMQRGINRGWLARAEFEPVVARAFAAVSQRTDEQGGFIDVSESTNKQNSLEAYLDREALAGRDARTGGFALLFAVERDAWLRVASASHGALPERLDDATFWKLIDEISEPSGSFADENFVSNEINLGRLLPSLTQSIEPGGVFIGVGPEQNFSYIAALRPGLAFVVDIRRQNMLEHLLYKALFESTDNRADFLARLFSRPRPAGLDDESTSAELFAAFRSVAPEQALFETTLADVVADLEHDRGAMLAVEDRAAIAKVLHAFFAGGPDIAYMYQDTEEWHPDYAELMEQSDASGTNRSYLGSEQSWQRVRDMQIRNLIVPVVGDFAGSKALRAIGDHVRAHGALIDVFYVSNVEPYLFAEGLWRPFYENVRTLPVAADSVFVRTFFGSTARLCTAPRPQIRTPMQSPIVAFLAAYDAGAIDSQCALVARSH